MKRIHFTLVLPVAALLAAGPARAGESGPVTLSIEEAIEMALGGNLELGKSALAVQLNEIAFKKKKAAFLPVVQGHTSTSLVIGKRHETSALSGPGWLAGSLSLGIGLDIVVFDGLANIAALRWAGFGLESSKLSLTRAQQQVMYDAIVAFVDLSMDDERVKVSEQNVASQEDVLGLVEARFGEGSALIADVYKQKAELESAKLALVQAVGDREAHEIELAVVLGLAPGADVSVTGVEPVGSEGAPAAPDVDVAVTWALAERPDLLAIKEEISAAGENVKVARAGYIPSISLFADLSSNWSSAMQSQHGFADQLFVENPGATMGLSISIPIFDAFSTKYDIETADVAVLTSELELESMEQQVEREVRLAWQDYQEASAQLELARKKLDYASKSEEAYEEIYAAGGCTLVDLSQARALRLQASYDVIEASYRLVLGAVTLYYTAGDTDGMLESLSS